MSAVSPVGSVPVVFNITRLIDGRSPEHVAKRPLELLKVQSALPPSAIVQPRPAGEAPVAVVKKALPVDDAALPSPEKL